MILTREQAQKITVAVDAAVGTFAFRMDVDQTTGRNYLFGALLASFVASNGAASRAELERLLTRIEDTLPAAAVLDEPTLAESVEVIE